MTHIIAPTSYGAEVKDFKFTSILFWFLQLLVIILLAFIDMMQEEEMIFYERKISVISKEYG
jgi:hypothetical protein